MSNYRIPRMAVVPLTEKQQQQLQIEQDTADYLAKGGQINVYPPGYSMLEEKLGNVLSVKTGWEKELRNPKK